MRFTAVLSVATLAGVSFAQNQAGQPGYGCAAQSVLVTCLGTQAARIASCKTLDYACMCQTQADVLQCYDQCPNDVNRSTEQSKLTAYCVAASATASVAAPATTSAAYTVQSSAPAATQSEDGSSPAPTDASGTSTDGSSKSKTSSAGGATSTDVPNSAAQITWMCASSLLAVLTAAFMAL
ncbi:hypothetical protein H072_9229 [Dactylellina haptotyla CBS 200.50]|uniref:Extracellular membrane protein CFEM domain-containing protein n=1 Tax=Dactylellina haptotyla (strain CBS 200.50) TaxID=1284197 RepID=S8A327_DACHA|nr:hypothetical protein H072_9229 [Dactylellina haptotyla CBS 200.50]